MSFASQHYAYVDLLAFVELLVLHRAIILYILKFCEIK